MASSKGDDSNPTLKPRLESEEESPTTATLGEAQNNSQAGVVLPILDGATAQPSVIPPELEEQKRIAADTHRDLEERIEAFEDNIDSEVGDTILSRARNIEREVGLTLRLRDAEGKRSDIRRADLEDLRCSGKSLMPDRLEKLLSPQDVADLIAYLQANVRSDELNLP